MAHLSEAAIPAALVPILGKCVDQGLRWTVTPVLPLLFPRRGTEPRCRLPCDFHQPVMGNQVPASRFLDRKAHVEVLVLNISLVDDHTCLELDIERLLCLLVMRQEIGSLPIVSQPDAGEAILGKYRCRLMEVVCLDLLPILSSVLVVADALESHVGHPHSGRFSAGMPARSLHKFASTLTRLLRRRLRLCPADLW